MIVIIGGSFVCCPAVALPHSARRYREGSTKGLANKTNYAILTLPYEPNRKTPVFDKGIAFRAAEI
ncbi:MAG: hypothetical protein IJT27_05500 [Clostridia bacterium]|nr:hypothetical protein [Clostridia bacterium]